MVNDNRPNFRVTGEDRSKRCPQFSRTSSTRLGVSCCGMLFGTRAQAESRSRSVIATDCSVYASVMTGRAWIERCFRKVLFQTIGAEGNPGACKGDRWMLDILDRSRRGHGGGTNSASPNRVCQISCPASIAVREEW